MKKVKTNLADYLEKKQYERTCVLVARASHLNDASQEIILNDPDLLPQFVSTDYCGEFFQADLEEDLGLDSTEESREVYLKAYLRGYNRGFERFESQCFGGVIHLTGT
jgi:hypothetical protein